ncbi:DUF927 domain-containing protein [Pseudomonas oryzae]|uniref:DUF927 domain-containing protein n=1 Tax=Pseudomonas oryzae TaxID=1392877 RepID=UPI000A4BAF09|nr:DUF927 domain-containing protein [Pseudomonas oryzae]
MINVIELIPDPEAAPLKRPCFRAYDHATPLDGKQLMPGVWHHGSKRDRDGNLTPVDEWLCGPLRVEAVTRSESKGTDYGRLLRFRNLDDRWLTWVMPGEMLAGQYADVLRVLLGMGLKIAHQHQARVVEYIAEQNPKRRVTAVTATGWHGSRLFVTPLENIGDGEAIYQAESNDDGDYAKAGSLEGWRDGIAALLPGNPILQLTIGTALAGALLHPLDIHTGGGFHLLSDSSNGKTTAVQCAASVWGHGVHFNRKWNATANGLEGIAALRNDSMLALDELGQADPSYVGDVVYGVADGIGKQRASRSTNARKVRRWRVMLLSSGEITLEKKMADAGKRTRAGQEVRLVTVSAGRSFGAWDHLHGHPNGVSLSDVLKHTSVTHYGHAGPEFVRMLIESGDFESLQAMLETIKKHFPEVTGQSARVAERFAIIALALELAAGMGLLPLEKLEGTTNMVELFKGWQTERGDGPSEDGKILRAIANFIDRHGGSRFQSVKDDAIEVRERAGYREITEAGPLYLFTRIGLEEAAKDFELPRVVRALDSVGAIAKRAAGKNQAKRRMPDGSTPWLYWIDPSRLEPEG